MSTSRFSVERLATATVIVAVLALACAQFANALKHTRLSNELYGEMSREVSALEERVEALDERVHSKPEP